MIYKVLEINQEDRYISLYRGFVVIKSNDKELARVPIDEIGVLLLSAQKIILSKNILNALAEEGCITILCGNNYSPMSMVLPVASHYLFAKIVKNQINASEPLKKRVWQQIVIAKIKYQAKTLMVTGKESDSRLIYKISEMVKSGDSDNREAYAAKMYWKALFGKEFLRNKEEVGINSFLNYGYAIIRSAMARAICAAGLIPSIGIHHDNMINQFCLVDDFMEIYRPILDCIVYLLIQEGETELTPKNKKRLANILYVKLYTKEGKSPLFQSMHYFASSYVNALDYKKAVIDIPEWDGRLDEES